MIRRSAGRPWAKSMLGIGAAALLCTGAAHALSIDVVAQGTMASYEPFHGPATVATFRYTLSPGDTVPWHYHTGSGSGIIAQGTLTETTSCGEAPETISAGSAFMEEPNVVHEVTSFGPEPVVIYWTETWPAGEPDTVFVEGPRCAPTTPAQCKDGGWRNYPGLHFRNEGDCVRYVSKQQGSGGRGALPDCPGR